MEPLGLRGNAKAEQHRLVKGNGARRCIHACCRDSALRRLGLFMLHTQASLLVVAAAIGVVVAVGASLGGAATQVHPVVSLQRKAATEAPL